MAGNLFKQMQQKFIGASDEQIAKMAEDAKSAFLTAAQLTNPQTAFKAMVMIAHIGLEAKDALTQKQRDFVNKNFNFYTGPMDDIYAIFTSPVAQDEYDMLEKFCMLGQDKIGMPLLLYVLSFSYCDGEPSQELSEKLEHIFSTAMLVSYMRDGEESDTEESEEEQSSYDEILAQWEEEVKAVKAQQNKYIEELKAEERENANSFFRTLRDKTIDYQTNYKKELEQAREAALAALSTLSSIHFIQRKKHQKVVDNANYMIPICDRAIKDAREKYEDCARMTEENLAKRAAHFQVEAVKRFPLPPKPVKEDPEKKKRKQQILIALEVIKGKGPMTMDELLANVPGLQVFSRAHLDYALHTLAEEGVIVQTEIRRRKYFEYK